jgi:glycine cleavage system aminomethyltransferase T
MGGTIKHFAPESKRRSGDHRTRVALEQPTPVHPAGIPKKLVGFTLADRNIARHGYPVFAADQASGIVRSGTMSPTLGVPIAACYVPSALAAPEPRVIVPSHAGPFRCSVCGVGWRRPQ